MELHTLRRFVGVADKLSFSRACEQLTLVGRRYHDKFVLFRTN
jgi:hypothetical protein